MPGTNTPVWPGRSGPEPMLLDATEAQLGRSVRLFRDGPPVGLINATGATRRAQLVTVQAQVIVPADGYGVGADRRAPIIGRLQWGQAGASFTADVDINNGTTFSLVASSVTLLALFDPSDVTPDTRAVHADCSASVVWGNRPARARPQRTLPRVPALADGGVATFAVPAFAYSLMVLADTAAFYAAASTSTITFHGGPTPADDPQLVVTAGALGTSQLTQEGVILGGSTRFVSVTNHTGAPLNLRASFALAL